MSFWTRVGIGSLLPYRQPTGREPLSACGHLATTGYPFVGRPVARNDLSLKATRTDRPVSSLAGGPGLDPSFDEAYLRAYRSSTGDDLHVDPAFNAAGEGSEIDEEELVAGCVLPVSAGGFGPLSHEDADRLGKAGERLAERLARVAHVDLPTARYDPASRFFYGRNNGKKRRRSRRSESEEQE